MCRYLYRRCLGKPALQDVKCTQAPISVLRHYGSWLTLGRSHFSSVLSAPAKRMQVGGHDVTPEVCSAVVLVTLITQQQQLPAGGDDGGYPEAFGFALHTYLELHAWREAGLQAQVDLEGNAGTTHCYTLTGGWRIGLSTTCIISGEISAVRTFLFSQSESTD